VQRGHRFGGGIVLDMTRKLLVGAIAAGALVVTTGTAFALTSNDAPTTSAAQPTTSTSDTTFPTTDTSTSEAPFFLSADDAGRIATDRVGGTVREVEREIEHGRAEWKVEVIGADGVEYDVRVDAETGAITRIDVDGRGGDDRGFDDHGGDRHGGDDRGSDDNPGGHDRGGDDHGGSRHGGDDH
jgi:uncharacterized membrane protein YkoI